MTYLKPQADRPITKNSQILPLWFQSVHIWFYFMIHTLFLPVPFFSCTIFHLCAVLKTIRQFFYLPSAICGSPWLMVFIISSNVPLRFSFIAWSLCLYQPQIPADHKDRPCNKNLMTSTRKRDASFKKKPQWSALSTYCNPTTEVTLYLTFHQKHMVPFPTFLLTW